MKNELSAASFPLFIILLLFAFLDIVISGLAVRAGAIEIGLLYQLVDNWQMACFIKGVGTFILGFILVSYRKTDLLAISCTLYFLLCCWNGYVLLQQVF